MFFSDGALREGLLYEMEERFARSDIRMRTTENLAKQHRVDIEHAARVKGHAREMLCNVRSELGIKRRVSCLIYWNGRLCCMKSA